MKFTDLEIQQFGKWQDLELQDLSDGLTVFYGPNEAGKTTLLQFIRGVLYGFAAGRRTKYLTAGGDGRGGGALRVLGPQGQFRLERSTSLRHPADGDLAVSAADGKPQGSRLLNVMLADVDEAVFNNVFAVGLREMQELGALSDTDAANALYSMTTGLDRVSLFEVLKQLETSRSRLLAGDESGCLIGRLQNRRQRLASEVSELSAARRRWIALREEHDHLGREIERIEQENSKLDKQASLIEAAITVRPSWLRREEIDRRLAEMGPKLDLSDEAIHRFERLNAKYDKHQEERNQLRTQRRQLRKQASKFGVNETLRRYGPRIEAVAEQFEWVNALEGQIDQLKTETDDLEHRWLAEKEKSGLQDDQNSPLIDSSLLKTLRPIARAQRSTREKLEAAERRLSETLEQVEKLDEHLSESLTGRKEKSLEQAVTVAGERVSNLRKRLQLEERLDSLYSLRKDLESRASLEGDDEMLPVGVLTGLGGMFVLGFVITISALIWYRQLGDLSWIGALLGMAMIASTPLVKFFLQQSNVFASDDAQRRLQRLRDEIDEAEEERDELDRRLPTGGGALASRLRQAEQELAELELLVPDATRQRSSMQAASEARDQVDQARKRHISARKAWKKMITDLGLPSHLSPKQIQELVERNVAVTDTLRLRNRRSDELDQRRREYEAVAARVKQLMTDIGITPEHDSLSGQVEQLLAIIRENERERGELGKLRREARELKREEIKHLRLMQKLRSERRELLSQAGCADSEDFQRRLEHASERRELDEERGRVTDQIHAAVRKATLGPAPEEEATLLDKPSLPAREWEATDEYGLLAELLTGENQDRLDQLWEKLGSRRERNEQARHRAVQKRGELKGQQQVLAEDRSLAERRFDLAQVDHQIEQGLQEWRVEAITSSLLDVIRKDFEEHRQPETLIEASAYLAKLTEGRYHRAWTPFGEQTLYVDEQGGQSWSVDMLSRGTREQLFLSLRLALVSLFARRGVQLPLVLDDVLVNFDAHRAGAAAKVMQQFADDGHQLLVFTCHEHVWEMFRQLGVDARRLPDNGRQWLEEPVLADQEEADVEPEPLPEPQTVAELEPVPELVPELVTEAPREVAPLATQVVERIPRPKKRRAANEYVSDYQQVMDDRPHSRHPLEFGSDDWSEPVWDGPNPLEPAAIPPSNLPLSERDPADEDDWQWDSNGDEWPGSGPRAAYEAPHQTRTLENGLRSDDLETPAERWAEAEGLTGAEDRLWDPSREPFPSDAADEAWNDDSEAA